MLKNRLWWIVVAMSLALLGIVLVQVYWIQNTIHQKEEIFSFQVNEALNKVADKVETNIAASVLSSQMSLFFSDSTYWVGNADSMHRYDNIMSDSSMAVMLDGLTGSEYYSKLELLPVEPFDEALEGFPNQKTSQP